MENQTFNELMQQGNALAENGKFDKAIQYYEKAKDIDRMNENVYLSIGLCYAGLENFESAKTELEKALKLNKRNGFAYYQLGNVEASLGNNEKAVDYYYKAVSNGFEDAQLFYVLGMICYEGNDTDSSLRYLKQCLSMDGGRVDARLRIISILADLQKPEEALREIEDLLEARFDCFEGHHLKCHLLCDMGRYDEAMESIEKGLEMFPKDTSLAVDKGMVYIRKNMGKEAFELFNEIENNPDSSYDDKRTLNTERAQFYLDNANVDEAIRCLINANDFYHQDNPESTDEESVFLLMNCYIVKEDFEKSLECAKELVKLEENSIYQLSSRFYEAFSLQKIGNLSEAKEKYNAAEEFYRNYLEKNPGDLGAYTFRIMALYENEKFDTALELADFICELYEQIPQAHQVRVTVLEKMGRTQEAEKEKDIIKKLQGENNE